MSTTQKQLHFDIWAICMENVQCPTVIPSSELYTHLQALVAALENDPYLSALSKQQLPQILQTMHMATGCDYISFSVE